MDNEKRQKQDDELLALQAIYEGDVEDIRLKDAWKVWRPAELLIHLRPSSGASGRPSDVYVGVDLHVTCSMDYPDCPPKIALENEKGLSKMDVAALQSMLTIKAEELKTQEMLLELCQVVQTFLYEKNAPPEYVSFHEGMEKRRARQLQQQKTEEQLLRDSSTKREAEEIEAELTRRQDELRLRKDDMRQRSASEVTERTAILLRTRRSTDTPVDSAVSTPAGDSIRVPILFADGVEHAIVRSNLPALLRPAPHRMCVEWAGHDDLIGAAVFVSEWTFECQLGKKTNRKAANMDEFLSLLSTVEKEAQVLFKLPKHPNVFRYLALDCSRRFVTGKSFVQKIYVVRSMDEDEQQLSRTLESRLKLPAEELSKIAKHILSALHFLHSRDILHKYILPDCIWEIPEKGHTLSDYYLRYRLLDLADCFCVCAQLPKDERVVIAGSGKTSRRSDIYCLGTVLTALANGEWAPQRDLLPQPPLMADTALVDFLNHCFGLNAEGWTAARLLEHSFILHGPAQRQKSLNDSLATTAEITDEELHFDDISVGGHRSRLGQEFALLKWLGKGGFGDVIMVRNKLDDNVYAIKRIPLNPRSKELNKKIIREAKLFSRLNHENVVRYFNSWIEATSKPANEPNDIAVAARGQPAPENDSELFMQPNLRDLEANAPDVGNSSVEWSTSFVRRESLSSSSSSDSADESLSTSNPVGMFASSFCGYRSDSSDAEVIFEGDASSESEHEISEIKSNSGCEDGKKDNAETVEDSTSRVLYIQMEFCENSTIRQAIDKLELVGNPRRIWRLFREMLEGLKYIHSRGMIHRDIKPVNIFLDGQDHVKIGDFGLATQDLPSKETLTAYASLDESSSHGLTTDIGTAFYVAPELIVPRKSGVKTPHYTHKVDIFSVGIVLFEMFYRPLEPGMERIQILTDIRNGPQFPSDFGISLPDKKSCDTAKRVISWTLTVDTTKRPTAEELLASDEVPVVEMRDTEFQSAFNKAITDKQSRSFRWTMDSLFNRLPTSTLDYCFDQDVYKDDFWVQKALRMNRVERKLAEMFRIHGAVPLVTPLLTPASMLARTLGPKQQSTPYLLIDKSGLIVALPYDLRYGFARLAARNEIEPLKRYAFGKAYRDGVRGEHPKEIAECAVDFLTDAASASTSTAEMLFILNQIGREMVGVHGRRCSLRLGHTKLVKAALLHAGVADDNEQFRVIHALPDAMAGNKDAQKFAYEMGLPLTAATTLYDVLRREGPLDRILSELRVLTKTSNASVSRLAKEALNDLEKIKTALDVLLACDKGADTIPLTIAVGLVQRPDVYMDGVVFTASVEMTRKKKKVDVVFAVGGRYDTLVKTIRQGHLDHHPPAAIGCSVWMDLLAEKGASVGSDASCSVLVCSQSGAPLLKEKLSFVHQLWTAGIAADLLHEPVEEREEREDLAEYCRKTGIAHLATMLDGDSVLLKTFDGERDREIKFSREVAVDVIRSDAKSPSADSLGSTSLVPTASSTKVNAGDAVHASYTAGTATATFANVKIRYTMLERPQSNTRKRIEMQIWAVLGSTVSKYSAKTTIEVLATELPLLLVRAIAGVVDQRSSAVELSAAMTDVSKRFNKYKREVQIVFDELRGLLLDLDRSVLAHKVIIVYGKETQAEEGFWRIIL